MSTYAHHQHRSMQVPPSHLEQPLEYCSPLDLLSRVALGQYSLPSVTIQSHNPTMCTAPAPPPPSAYHSHPILPLKPLPSLRLPTFHNYTMSSHTPISTPPPRQPMLYHADYSPVSSEDGTVASSRLSPDLPSRISKAVHMHKHRHVPLKSRSQPSRFCHICSRTSKKVGLVACANFETGACRKVVCQKCFNDHNWDWEAAFNSQSKWVCTHCRRQCPERAQCAIYRRTNERRREQQQQHRSHRAETLAALRVHSRFTKHYR